MASGCAPPAAFSALACCRRWAASSSFCLRFSSISWRILSLKGKRFGMPGSFFSLERHSGFFFACLRALRCASAERFWIFSRRRTGTRLDFGSERVISIRITVVYSKTYFRPSFLRYGQLLFYRRSSFPPTFRKSKISAKTSPHQTVSGLVSLYPVSTLNLGTLACPRPAFFTFTTSGLEFPALSVDNSFFDCSNTSILRPQLSTLERRDRESRFFPAGVGRRKPDNTSLIEGLDHCCTPQSLRRHLYVFTWAGSQDYTQYRCTRQRTSAGGEPWERDEEVFQKSSAI